MVSNAEKVKTLGWLDEDGICQFPEEVVACCLGFITPGISPKFWQVATPKMIQEVIDKGWIKFIDGNGTRYTFVEYCDRFPAYPDPIFQLTLQGRFPPNAKKFVKLGKS